ncbi:hypothetical protein [Pseudalkalibacillus sp. SCS-8]|uniref:hypothetical protein n=1 Tax=Pseudalkalibacillus nanhaiensis TaxID=3115291 RepID=UPI0032DB270D
MNHAHFIIPSETEEHEVFPKPKDYLYWKPLMSYFLKHSDTVEFQCWMDEQAVVREVESTVKDGERSVDGSMVIVKTAITHEIEAYIVNQFVSAEGKLKWFSVFLSREDRPCFHGEHWGTEFTAFNYSKEDMAFVQSVVPSDTQFIDW